jgi:hypothetical protein
MTAAVPASSPRRRRRVMATGRDAVLEIVRAYMGGTRLKETQSASQDRCE